MVRLVYRGWNVWNRTNHITTRPSCGADKHSAVWSTLLHPYEPGWLSPVRVSQLDVSYSSRDILSDVRSATDDIDNHTLLQLKAPIPRSIVLLIFDLLLKNHRIWSDVLLFASHEFLRLVV